MGMSIEQQSPVVGARLQKIHEISGDLKNAQLEKAQKQIAARIQRKVDPDAVANTDKIEQRPVLVLQRPQKLVLPPQDPVIPDCESPPLNVVGRWASTKRGIPSVLVRCPLFAGVRSPRFITDERVLASQGKTVVIRRGGESKEWTQLDLTTLLQFIHISDEYNTFKFAVDETLRLFGVVPNNNSRIALENSCTRLMGLVRIDSQDEKWNYRHRFPLLTELKWATLKNPGEDDERICSGVLHKNLFKLFEHGNVTHIDFQQRLALPTGFPQWLHAFYSSHRDPIPLQVEDLAKWAGITGEKKELNRKTRAALEALKTIGFLKSFEVSYDGRVVVERAY